MNPSDRDTVEGTAASASAESYRQRRQGTLTRQSDGFRTPYPLAQPRGYVQKGYAVDEPSAPYRPNPASRPGDKSFPDVPRNFRFFKLADIGAPRVGFPDRQRTQGHLQQSGAAWGRIGEQPRAVLRPRVDGTNRPPSLSLGERGNTELIPRSMGPRWKRPSSPTIFDHLPH